VENLEEKSRPFCTALGMATISWFYGFVIMGLCYLSLSLIGSYPFDALLIWVVPSWISIFIFCFVCIYIKKGKSMSAKGEGMLGSMGMSFGISVIVLVLCILLMILIDLTIYVISGLHPYNDKTIILLPSYIALVVHWLSYRYIRHTPIEDCPLHMQ